MSTSEEDGEFTEVLQICRVVPSILSMFGAVMVLTHRFDCTKETNWTFQRVSRIACGNLIAAFGNALDNSNAILCNMQGFIITFGGALSFIYILCISLEIGTIMFYWDRFWVNKQNQVRQIKFIYVDIIIVSMALILSIIPVFIHGYQHLAAWCWISRDTPAIEAMRFASYYIWMLLAFFVSVIVYGRIFYSRNFHNLNVQNNNASESWNMHLTQSLESIKLYPIIFIVCYFVGAIRRSMELFGAEKLSQTHFLVYSHIFLSCLWGFFNYITFRYIAKQRHATRVAASQSMSSQSRLTPHAVCQHHQEHDIPIESDHEQHVSPICMKDDITATPHANNDDAEAEASQSNTSNQAVKCESERIPSINTTTIDSNIDDILVNASQNNNQLQTGKDDENEQNEQSPLTDKFHQIVTLPQRTFSEPHSLKTTEITWFLFVENYNQQE